MTSTETQTAMRVLTRIYQYSGLYLPYEISQDLNTPPHEIMMAISWLLYVGLVRRSDSLKLELTSKAYEQLVDRPGRPHEQVRDLVRTIVQGDRS
jgi:hypothetical protein